METGRVRFANFQKAGLKQLIWMSNTKYCSIASDLHNYDLLEDNFKLLEDNFKFFKRFSELPTFIENTDSSDFLSVLLTSWLWDEPTRHVVLSKGSLKPRSLVLKL